MERFYLKVAKRDRGRVQTLGARFDGEMGRYYVPEGVAREPFAKWKYVDKQPSGPTKRARYSAPVPVTPGMGPPFVDAIQEGERIWLGVSYQEKELAKHAGAKWDALRQCWYIYESHPDRHDMVARWPVKQS